MFYYACNIFPIVRRLSIWSRFSWSGILKRKVWSYIIILASAFARDRHFLKVWSYNCQTFMEVLCLRDPNMLLSISGAKQLHLIVSTLWVIKERIVHKIGLTRNNFVVEGCFEAKASFIHSSFEFAEIFHRHEYFIKIYRIFIKASFYAQIKRKTNWQIQSLTLDTEDGNMAGEVNMEHTLQEHKRLNSRSVCK